MRVCSTFFILGDDMPNYDGSIRINTEIQTKQAEKELKSLESIIAKNADKIASLRSKMDALKDVKIPTSEYKKTQNELDKIVQKYEEVSDVVKTFEKTGTDKDFLPFKQARAEAQDLYIKIEDLRGKLFDLEESGKAFTLGSDTKKYTEMSAQMEKLNQQMRSDTERQKELQDALAEREQRLTDIKVNSTIIDQDIIDLLERREQLVSKISDMEQAGVGLGYKQYEDANIELEEVNSKIKKYKDNIASVSERFSKMRNSVGKAFNAISNGIMKSGNMFSFLKNSANKAFSSVSKGTKQSASLLSTFGNRLKGLAASAFIFNLISKGFSSMVSSMKTGFSNLMAYSGSFANSIQNIKNSLSTLGNQMASAFSPIVQAIIPWLNQLISVLSIAISYVSQFIAALTGKGTYIRAKKVQDSYGASLGGTAKKEEEVADNADNMSDSLDDTTKSAKKARGALAAFDDLDVLEKQDDSTDAIADKIKDFNKELGNLGGDGVGDLFEEVPIENSILDAVEKLKDILSQLFAPLKEAWEREGKFVIDSWKYALGEVWQLIKDIGRDFLTMWNQEATIQMLADVLHIVGDIGLIVGNLAHNLDEAWNKNQIGLQILENIRNIFAVIISNIREAADYTVMWSEKLDFYPLLESIERLTSLLIPLADKLSSALVFLYENALLPIAKWTIESALPASIDVVSAAIKVLNSVIEALKPLGAWLWDNFLQPLGKWAGDAVIFALQTIADLLTKFSDWISENQSLIENFVIIIGSFFAAWEMANFAATIYGIVSALTTFVTTGGLAATASYALGAAIAFLTSPITIVTAIIGALIAVGILLYKNWDTIKEKVGQLKDWIIEKWEAIAAWFSELPEKIGVVIDAIVEWFNGLPEKIGYALGFALGKVVEWALELFAYLSEKIPEIIESVVTFFKELPGKIYDAIIAIGEKIVEWKDAAIEFFKTNIPIIIENVVEFFKELPEKLVDIGKNVIEGLWEGIQNAKEWLSGKITEFCSGFIDGFKNALGIHSPSKKTKELGEYTIDGFVIGLENKASRVSDIWTMIKEQTVSILQSLGDWISNFGLNISDKFVATLQNIQDQFMQAWTAIYENTIDTWTMIQEYFTEFWTLFIEYLIETWEEILLVFTENFEEIQLLFEEFITFLNEIFLVSWLEAWTMAGEQYRTFHDLVTMLTKALQDILTLFMKKIQELINTIWKQTWKTGEETFVEFANKVEEVVGEVRSVLEEFFGWCMSMIQSILSGIASIASAASSISFGGFSAGGGAAPAMSAFSTQSFAALTADLPHLASGSVLRGGNPFMAILNDQPRGQTNVEAPLSTIKQALREEMSGMDLGGGSINADMILDGEPVGRLLLPYIIDEMKRQGYNVGVLGVT